MSGGTCEESIAYLDRYGTDETNLVTATFTCIQKVTLRRVRVKVLGLAVLSQKGLSREVDDMGQASNGL